jgi:aspartyl-tRNA synthetase
MNAFAQKEGLPGMGYIFWREGEGGAAVGAGPVAKNIGPERTEAIRQQLGLGAGDAAFFLGGQAAGFQAVAAKARDEIGREKGLTDEDRFEFAWIVDFPMYERDEETGTLDFSHNPFSMPQGGMEALENQDPLEILGYQYDIVCNGYGAQLGRGPEPPARDHVQGVRDRRLFPRCRRPRFGGMISAFRYGAPPHGGMRAGDRPDRDAAGRRGEYPRGHHVPDEPAGPGPDDGRARPADQRPASRIGDTGGGGGLGARPIILGTTCT